MNSTMWTYFFMVVGILGIVLINAFSDLLIANEQDYYILKEATEAAMIDSIDQQAYRDGLGHEEIVVGATSGDVMHCETPNVPGTIRIREEKFVESFLFRFASAAGMKKNYLITINDIDECPPKVSITIKAVDKYSFLNFFRVDYNTVTDEQIVNKITAILERDKYER